MAAAVAVLVVSGCSASDGPATAERTTVTTTTTLTPTTAAAPSVPEPRQLCVELAAVDLSNPQELLTIQPRTTGDHSFQVPLAYLAAKLVALESALRAGTNPEYPTQEAVDAAKNVLDLCRQRGYV
ncbi:hypothetical protein DFJ66_8121 [Saccharothrix variisporea]|uniref:DUF732 domain-containing protein n=1 Tax=Saccharothrix variisporea TaxID=543527 RepID=A0A495XJP9_9PSEU|nr:hypothetical protein DFJ66_8121 [Saccharothrix variisporea]